jgi:hypothetical protein
MRVTEFSVDHPRCVLRAIPGRVGSGQLLVSREVTARRRTHAFDPGRRVERDAHVLVITFAVVVLDRQQDVHEPARDERPGIDHLRSKDPVDPAQHTDGGVVDAAVQVTEKFRGDLVCGDAGAVLIADAARLRIHAIEIETRDWAHLRIGRGLVGGRVPREQERLELGATGVMRSRRSHGPTRFVGYGVHRHVGAPSACGSGSLFSETSHWAAREQEGRAASDRDRSGAAPSRCRRSCCRVGADHRSDQDIRVR